MQIGKDLKSSIPLVFVVMKTSAGNNNFSRNWGFKKTFSLMWVVGCAVDGKKSRVYVLLNTQDSKIHQ